MQTVAIIDYGSGNLHSAAKAFERAARDGGLNQRIIVTSRAAEAAAADRIVLPGVGAFADCKAGLAAVPDMIETLSGVVQRRARPFLGICVGMQLLATRGLEFVETDGLNWIPGEVRRIEPNDRSLKVPHMGWNTLSMPDARQITDRGGRQWVTSTAAGSGGANSVGTADRAADAPLHPLLDGIALGPGGLHAYFVHSYHLAADDPACVVAVTDYGAPVTAMVALDTIVGVQFHPEKSQALGLTLISNFLKWAP